MTTCFTVAEACQDVVCDWKHTYAPRRWQDICFDSQWARVWILLKKYHSRRKYIGIQVNFQPLHLLQHTKALCHCCSYLRLCWKEWKTRDRNIICNPFICFYYYCFCLYKMLMTWTGTRPFWLYCFCGGKTSLFTLVFPLLHLWCNAIFVQSICRRRPVLNNPAPFVISYFQYNKWVLAYSPDGCQIFTQAKENALVEQL